MKYKTKAGKNKCHPEFISGSTPIVIIQNKEEMLKQVQHDSRHGFTLIELLVVVLIIGILTAVAVPQYQKVVLKARFSTIKNMTHSLLQAEKIYFLANGNYTLRMSALGICEEDEDSENRCYYDWGFCALYADNVQCNLFDKTDETKLEISYQVYMESNIRLCIARNQNLSSIQNTICKSETGASNYTSAWSGNYSWTYQ